MAWHRVQVLRCLRVCPFGPGIAAFLQQSKEEGSKHKHANTQHAAPSSTNNFPANTKDCFKPHPGAPKRIGGLACDDASDRIVIAGSTPAAPLVLPRLGKLRQASTSPDREWSRIGMRAAAHETVVAVIRGADQEEFTVCDTVPDSRLDIWCVIIISRYFGYFGYFALLVATCSRQKNQGSLSVGGQRAPPKRSDPRYGLIQIVAESWAHACACRLKRR